MKKKSTIYERQNYQPLSSYILPIPYNLPLSFHSPFYSSEATTVPVAPHRAVAPPLNTSLMTQTSEWISASRLLSLPVISCQYLIIPLFCQSPLQLRSNDSSRSTTPRSGTPSQHLVDDSDLLMNLYFKTPLPFLSYLANTS